jgi:amidase
MWSATVAADMVRRGEVSSRELTEQVLARIDAVNPRLNAVVETRREAALAEADAVDRGAATGPLRGVPITVKEAFHVAGMHSTWGNPAFRAFVADRDATVVSRLRAAGAVVVGTTNVAFMLGDFGQTANELYGTTVNPWDPDRTPGGSSGGAAAAVAAGLSFLDYGSDLAGSIRVPAGFCGVYGLKPTADLVPLAGFQPPGPPAPPSDMTYLSAVGPLARGAADLRTALQVTAGPDGAAAKACSWRLPPARQQRLADYRVGVVLDDPNVSVTGEVGAVLSDAVDALARSGVTVTEGWPEGVDPRRGAECFGAHVDFFFAMRQPDGELPPTFVAQENRRMALRAAWQHYFDDVDVFLCPTNFTAPFPHDTRPFAERTIGDRSYGEQAFWISHASIAGLPAVAAPAGRTRDGLPVGIQIVGPRYEDDTPITFAELLPDVTGGYVAPA